MMDTTHFQDQAAGSGQQTSSGMRPGAVLGALVGLLLTIPLAAVYFFFYAFAGTSFPPFSMFDWMVRVEGIGPLINFGKEVMISVLTTVQLGELSSVAKTAEQMMGVVGMLATGVLAGALFFAYLSSRDELPKSRIPGLVLGLILGIPVTLITMAVYFSATAPAWLSALLVLVGFVAWGAIMQYVYVRLSEKEASAAPQASVEGMDRRSFLVRVGGASAVITVVGAGLGALLQPQTTTTSTTVADSSTATDTGSSTPDVLPNADAAVQPVPGTRPELTPVEDHYRIDISSQPPVIDGESYTMPIFGLVGNELALSLDDLRNNYEPMTQYVTLSCISNSVGGTLISTQKWTGVSMQNLLADADLPADAKYLRIFSADGFDETVSIDLINQDPRIMMTYAWDDEPLPVRNGFPLRIYIPDRFGMKQPKWITEIEVVSEYEDGYWVRRNWDREAIMVTTSVVDVVAVDEVFEEDGQTFVPIGGIAHAGDRGISKVDVRMDEGEWMEAELREPISDTTWVLWRINWPFEAGAHRFEVRSVDGEGDPQLEESRRSQPSGAAGIHGRNVTL